MTSERRADRPNRDEDARPVGGGTIWARVMGAKLPPAERKALPGPPAPAPLGEDPAVFGNA